METVVENEVMRVGVMPAYGARVSSLFDKQSGREWMAQGAPSPNTGEAAIYGAAEAIGWDECFPTVGPWDARETVWARPLRDHGDLWGRRWSVTAQAVDRLATAYATDEFRFVRTLRLRDNILTAAYEVENRTPRDMPCLWALHGLLAVTPGDRILIDGVDRVSATYLNHHGRTLASGAMSWPDTHGGLPVDLSRVQPAASEFAGKFYAAVPSRRASVGRDGAVLTLSWDEGLDLGIWLNYGGWPSAGGSHHVALEPTVPPLDDLGEAVRTGTAMMLPPAASRRWTVTLTTSRERPQ